MTFIQTKQQSFVAGTTVRFTATYSDGITDIFTDPVSVSAGYFIEGESVVQTVFGDGLIIKDGVGIYHWDIDTTGFAGPRVSVLMTMQWAGEGTIDIVGDPQVISIIGPAFVPNFSA